MRWACRLLLPALLPLACTALDPGSASPGGLNESGLPSESDETRRLRIPAEGGDAKAQYDLAVLYYAGRGVGRNYVEAARWYRKAAEQGRADAQFYTGAMYYHGLGVALHHTHAATWLRKSAEQGYAPAQEFLGKMHFDGEGVAKDPVEGYKWEILAASRATGEDLRKSASTARGIMAVAMTGEQIAKAERLAREWRSARQTMESLVRELALKTFCAKVGDGPFFIEVDGRLPSHEFLERLGHPRYRSIAQVETRKEGGFEVPANGAILRVDLIEWPSDREVRLRLSLYRGPLNAYAESLVVERNAAGQWSARVVPGSRIIS